MTPSTSPEAVIKHAERPQEKQNSRSRVVGSNRNIRRALVDLPAEPRAVTTAGVVWLYYTLGIVDAEIAEATGLKLQQVEMIKRMQLFEQLDALLKEGLARMAHEDVQQRIDNLTGSALDGLEDLLEDEDTKPATRARILMNMLDRGGFAPKQVLEHKHSLEGGLTIRHIKDIALPKQMP